VFIRRSLLVESGYRMRLPEGNITGAGSRYALPENRAGRFCMRVPWRAGHYLSNCGNGLSASGNLVYSAVSVKGCEGVAGRGHTPGWCGTLSAAIEPASIKPLERQGRLFLDRSGRLLYCAVLQRRGEHLCYPSYLVEREDVVEHTYKHTYVQNCCSLVW
jgi:hypothetical protein